MNKLAFALASLVAVPAFAAPSTWDIDPVHSAATFTIKHLAVSTVRGELGKITGAVTLDGADVKTGKVEASIEVNGINTREAKRDAHLKSPDFFDVAKFPTITFKSTKIEPAANGAFKLTGDLTMHGVTKSVTLDAQALAPEAKSPYGATVTGTSATGKIKRKDFGITGGGAGALVGDEVTVTIDLELVKKVAK